MSHHHSGPEYGFPHGDARLDLTDLYALPKPGDDSKSILIMDVHPPAAVNPPGLTTQEPFATQAVYELEIDSNGDAVADIAYRVRFWSTIDLAPVSTEQEARVTEAGDYRFFAGWPERPSLLRHRRSPEQLPVHGSRLFRGEECVHHRAGSA